ncbi:TetR/AcrR family transcriptional regulator [Pedobacter sp. HDW13]|uniref:TetR/AcrR family transcriptional regulator n=1 Tax=unclassified Pedobacter TaxID=2628915 RepID=UPI000F5ABD99|nr:MULTISPECIES: TetR/AcrR family transcriptional regulator [unclassified Pedobacter]QIL41349.1 TetR/AcrR family transcriptional regulator [Pedobacter sp. HDW13]RQO78119.1 TetR/AcrR family transcriptional regulator [Pedobacter sp. KBW01]
MPLKNTGTEQLIKDTAKRLIFAEGKLHATTQEIADAAGVNRTALHYYFRSRDLLIAAVFQEAMQGLSERLNACMASAKPFRQKVEFLIEVFLKDMMAFPYQETFLVTEINTLGKQLVGNIDSGPVESFLNEVQQEMDSGNVKTMPPYQFLMNLFSLLSYPLIMAPLYKQLFQLTDNAFDELITARKAMIVDLIFIHRG